MSPRTISGVFFNPASANSDKLRALRAVLVNWISLVEQYSKAFESDDACYWYSERANVGVLASAAAKTRGGWIALEEFPTKKKNEKGEKQYGRCDLYIAKKEHDLSFAFEAKQVWPGVNIGTDELPGFVAEKMKLASNDAQKLDKAEASTRVAACFVVPPFSGNKHTDPKDPQFESLLKKWVKGVKSNERFDGVAWVFPASSRDLKNGRSNLYPGVCLLLQVRRRGIKKKNGT